ncbi:MAG: UDP-glucose/GDP-mannose dehydrogenase family protein [Anaerolineales bacterium]|nr:UDP-glucose/GDP-mannose dehydrogenase family protein [Anaerolineales bacterium]
MKDICVVGVGYVGLVTAAGFADLGNRVTALDINEEKVRNLRKGILPIYEPGLEEVVRRNMQAGRLSFTTSYDEALKQAKFAFIAVGTPEGVDGEADLQYVREAAISIAKAMGRPLIVVNKSTVPVGTGDWVAEIIRSHLDQALAFSVVSCPEFLREGCALADFLNPARTVLGSMDREAADKVAQLHLPLRAPIVITDLRTAEMIKYASNAFLATKISFINEIANICEALGADVKEVASGMGYDPRIGRMFLEAGIGYGGSCFPKDVKALAHMASVQGRNPQLLQAVMDINEDRLRMVLERVESLAGDLRQKEIGLLGLAFKSNTDDMREAPAQKIAAMLRDRGAAVRAYDPVAMDGAARVMPGVRMCADPYALAEGADALVVVTDWNEFKQLDLPKIRGLMRAPNLIDGRNIYEPEEMKALGFRYRGIGRGYNGARTPPQPQGAKEAER